MKYKIFAALLVFAVTTTQAQNHVDFDKKIDFKTFKSFRFEPGRVIRKLGVRDTSNTFLNL